MRLPPLLFFLSVSFLATGQVYIDEFGQNRLQYKEFNWKYYSSQNFDVYYYSGGGDYAKDIVNYAEKQFEELTDILGYAPYYKTRIFIYNSIQDHQQSNKGIDGATFTTAGQTDFVKLDLEIAYNGSSLSFRQELIYKLSRILIDDMMFGGSLTDIFQNSYLLSLPKWFLDGVARHLAYGWNAQMDDFTREYINTKKVSKLKKIPSAKSGLVGHSIWNYISLHYGASNISNILNLTRIIRNEEKSIESTLGIDFKQFIANWKSYYTDARDEVLLSYQLPLEEDRIDVKKSGNSQFNNVRVNESGDKIAYTLASRGQYSIMVRDIESGDEKEIYKAGLIVPQGKEDYKLPLIDWADNETLGIVSYKRGQILISTLNIKSGRKQERPLRRFEQIKSFAFNSNGRLAVISGSIDGNNDLFLISMRRSAVRRLTSDIYDDNQPYFIPGSSAIVFSSNRPSDVIKVDDAPLDELNDNFNVYLYDLDTTTTNFYRITNSFGADQMPLAKNSYEIFYLSSKSGINNLYKYSFFDSTHTQITNFAYSILDYDLHFDRDALVFSMESAGRRHLYYSEEVDFNNNNFAPQTPRQRFIQAKFMSSRYAKEPQVKVEKRIDNDEVLDSGYVNTEDYSFLEESKKDSSEYIIDTEDYVFESDSKSNNNPRPESFFSQYDKYNKTPEIYGPLRYSPKFSFKNLVTNTVFDPLRGSGNSFGSGMGIFAETQIDDIFENQKLNIGVFILLNDSRNGDIFLDYKYLKYGLDFGLRLDNKRYFIQPNGFEMDISDARQKYVLNQITFTAALPISNYFRFEFNPFFTHTNFTNLNPASISPNSNPTGNQVADNSDFFAGISFRSVFDNSIKRGYNILHGTSAKLEWNQYGSISDRNKTFGKVKLDIRNYLKIHKEIAFAVRLLYGKYYGRNKADFMLGGVENWLDRRVDQRVNNDPLTFANDKDNSNILFSEFVTNLRGFNYNSMSGESVMMANAELRIPLFQYLSKGALSNSFLRNFQMICFYDVGTAWDGKVNFFDSESVSETVYPFPDPDSDQTILFAARIRDYKSPWLMSLGGGIRTMLLGYFVRFDISRPIVDGIIKDYRFQLSIGLDF